jgi:hypothetical protein
MSRGHPNSHDLIRSALHDVVALVEQPLVVIQIDEDRTRSACRQTVLDYLDHNEAGLAVEHLIYAIGEADLPIGDKTYDAITAAVDILGVDQSKLRGINPSQEPINTLQALSQVSDDTYTLAVKLLQDDHWIGENHKGPFPGTHLAELRGEEARPLLDLVNQFEPAEQERCHLPRYSLVFWGPNHPVAEAALCFQCNNGRTRIASELGWINFDGKAAPATELLEWMKLIEAEATT